MSKTILVVDDSPTVRALLKIYLRDLQATVLEADSGLAALSILQTRPVDLVISDVEMPGISGVEVCHAVRTGGHNPMVPMVLISANVDAHRSGAKLAGANMILSKPVFGSALRDAAIFHLGLSNGIGVAPVRASSPAPLR